MKLLRYGPKGHEKPGLLDGQGRIRDLGDHVPDIDGPVLAPDRLASLERLDPETLPLVEGTPRLGPPVTGVGKIIAIGLNYAGHAAETGADLPGEPLIFSKAVTSLSGPCDPVMLPKGSTHTDWEVELALVVGRRAQYVSEEDALDFVAGYAVMEDVSERDYQKNRGGQWTKGKSFDGFGPLGPWLVTRDEITDPQSLNLRLDVNFQRRQDANTKDMIFTVPFLVAYISQFMTLMPGDVITTGTPPGVGAGCAPPEFLKPGDVMRLGIEGLGEQTHSVLAWAQAA